MRLTYLLIYLVSLTTLATINPSKLIYPLTYLNKDIRVLNSSTVQVNAQKINNDFHQSFPRIYQMDRSVFENYQRLGSSVFKISRNGRIGSSNSHGTAFLIKGNIILTNHHVVHDRMNGIDCNMILIQYNNQGTTRSLSCRKIIKCNRKLDYCFIEMRKPQGARFLSDLYPVFKFKRNTDLSLLEDYLIIGNAKTNGIQFGVGTGAELIRARIRNDREIKDVIKFFAPVLPGNSGSPLFNSLGQVVGLVVFEITEDVISQDGFNLAYPINKIFEHAEMTFN